MFCRRRFVQGGVACLGVAMQRTYAGLWLRVPSDTVEVKTRFGVLRGASEKGVVSFKGVVVHQNPAQEGAMVRCSKSSTSGRAFGADGKSRVFPTGQTGWESSNTVTHTVKLAVTEGRSSTLPLRSDDAGHQAEETIESYFRLVEGYQSAGLLAYPSRAPDASDPHGSSVGIQP